MLEINRKLISGVVRKRLFSLVKRIQQPPLQYSAFFALRQSRVVLKTFQTIYSNMRTSQEIDFRLITTSRNNLSEIHIPRPTP